ncbi:Phosphatidylinositol-4-phosphate 5-kinase [Thoreauomyces humboldtii]|nr:Phosphatidylinositol-4-phosphate 5-kinase [Thoreauomyces humboldtii]
MASTLPVPDAVAVKNADSSSVLIADRPRAPSTGAGPAPIARPQSNAEAALEALQNQPQDLSRLQIDPRKRPNSFSGPASVSPHQHAKTLAKGTSHSVGTPRTNEILSTAKHLIPLSEIESSTARRRANSSAKKLSAAEGGEYGETRDNKFHRRLTKQKSEKEVLVGSVVKEGHENFPLMYDMLTGLRVSVSRCQAKPSRVLVKEDFKACHKMTFDLAGTELTPSSRYEFKFKDYCPWVFRCVRDAFNVDPAEYLLSLTGKYVLSEVGSPGKSGSFFYYSSDYRYIIKTIKRGEKNALMGFITWYYEHCRTNPNTTLCRILGLHRVKLAGNRKLHFVVMLNVFPPNKDIHEMYDLKGSTVGREFPEDEAKDDPRAVLKDLNWMHRNRKLQLGPQKSQLFVEQLERDVLFLTKHKIMDYSLLVGIHDLKRGNKENIRDKTLAVYEPNPEAVLARQATIPSTMMARPVRPVKDPVLSRSTSGVVLDHNPLVASPESSSASGFGERLSTIVNPKTAPADDLIQPVGGSDAPGIADVSLPAEAPSERAACIFYSDDGGFLSSDENDQPGDYLYYLGTIDIFTTYDLTKKIEHFWKSFSHDASAISAVNPKAYGERFMSFMKNAIRRPKTMEAEGSPAETT